MKTALLLCAVAYQANGTQLRAVAKHADGVPFMTVQDGTEKWTDSVADSECKSYTQSDIKFIALDLDGTFLNSTGQVPPANQQVTKRALDKGLLVFPCTARSRLGALQIIGADALETMGMTGFPGIYMNGADVYDDHGNAIHTGTLEPEIALSVMSELHDQGFSYGVATREYTYTRHGDYLIADHFDMVKETPAYPVSPQRLVEIMKTGEAIAMKLQIKSLDVDSLLAWAREVPENYPGYNAVQVDVNVVDFMREGESKAHGLSLMVAYYNSTRKNLMAVGDGFNDLAMLRYAGVGVSMANAPRLVKEAADCQTRSQDEDGVALAITTIALEE